MKTLKIINRCLTYAFLLITLSCTRVSEDTTQLRSVEIPEKVSFAATDGLKVSANLYHKEQNQSFIILCHQAGANKVEYWQIARNLLDNGFNCLAIDQRAGANLLDFANETNQYAAANGYSTDFVDAERDIAGAINYITELYDQPILLWGSSYSASLVLAIAKKSKPVSRVLAFSPAQYTELGNDYVLADSIRGLDKPTFITSTKEENNSELLQLIGEIDSSHVVHFIPQSAGVHGSAALWKTRPGHEEYWTAVMHFLKEGP